MMQAANVKMAAEAPSIPVSGLEMIVSSDHLFQGVSEDE
jgi:hypothetical protein